MFCLYTCMSKLQRSKPWVKAAYSTWHVCYAHILCHYSTIQPVKCVNMFYCNITIGFVGSYTMINVVNLSRFGFVNRTQWKNNLLSWVTMFLFSPPNYCVIWSQHVCILRGRYSGSFSAETLIVLRWWRMLFQDFATW